ncbi:hypothetical protein MIB92_06575 [Aestuariirhabdus sp. Z084]|uniref:hypothetical protein n=1 Tax=Aestuariirhabdus haliotis TaxID=2918751 RepID=UPI00201B3928|nr:hypothetical protein [Aestuariirhabdus haliotis]MCL6415308.1 hypothetical protein [Aestuariirhabdus haliotis]MCL6419568.1 hypothetical protein [Aestuariirhabdus haliotis]
MNSSKAHGQYRLNVVDQVIHIKYTGSFNEEGFNAFRDGVRDRLYQHNLGQKAWGTIDDISDWKLSVPETAGPIRSSVIDSVRVNRRYIALVDSKQGLARELFLSYIRDIDGLECRVFTDEADAWDWYRELGLVEREPEQASAPGASTANQ